MMRIGVIMLTIASVLIMLACVSNRAPTTGAPRVGKPLVKRLPAGIEGVELVGGTVRAKSGYKWVKQPNGSVTVARMADGGWSVPGGSWECLCQATLPPPAHECTLKFTSGGLRCVYKTCLGTCALNVTTQSGVRTAIIAY